MMPLSGSNKKDYQKEYMKRKRSNTGLTDEGSNMGGLTWYPNKPTDDKGNPITPVILHDGQKWYPKAVLTHPNPIEKKRRNIECDNGAYIDVNKLVDPKWRGLLTYLVENLKPAYQDSIRVGMSGPSVRECKKLLEVTG